VVFRFGTAMEILLKPKKGALQRPKSVEAGLIEERKAAG
jgi:hypothetical protein